MHPAKRATIALFSVVGLLPVLCGADRGTPSSVSVPDATYVQSFEKWKAEQIDDLKKNWLPLAGLYWLKPGANSFGSAAENAIVFPKGPAHAGEFDLKGKDVTIKLLAEVHATSAGKPLAGSATLDPDTSGHPSAVEIGSLQFHVIVRGERVGVRLKDADSAAVRNFRGLMFYPLDMNYQIAATWEPSDGKTTVEVPNVLGDVSAMRVAGRAVFKINGQEVVLTDLRGDPSRGLFFVFNDLTAKTDTYPGGRFLETGPVTKGRVTLDFNRAYNPPCAVTPYATCPLAPKENRLAVAIPAGEKFDKSAHGHH
jgi:uncharacterized protein